MGVPIEFHTTMEVSTSSSGFPASPAEAKACGFEKLSEGKRHLLVGEIPDAVSSLALACELLAKQFGETHKECADAYFYYGKSLLDMARLENGVLGNALEGVPEGGDIGNDSQVEDPEQMTEDERSAVETKVNEALDFNYQTCEVEKEQMEADNATDDEIEDADKPSQDISAPMEEENSPMEDDPVDDQKTSDAMNTTTEEKVDDGDEEAGNLQQSWEMFELAKLIYKREVETEAAEKKIDVVEKISDSLLHLGEISIENENYEQALEDIGECLKMRQNHFPADSRSIAEAHYQLGMAQSQSGKFTEAKASLTMANEVLQARLAGLKKMESSEFLSKEIADLTELIKEVEEKVADFEEMKAQVTKKMKGLNKEDGNPSAEEKPAAAIAVKRKE